MARFHALGSLVAFLVSAAVAPALDAATRCEQERLKPEASYHQCRMRAEAKALRNLLAGPPLAAGRPSTSTAMG